ncbi:NTP transferase domain-containing protein [Candidatus Roizmanbacteria bacterium]|nr:NTP transferase domain-containing protein [Candidatus Roizmanbacteria bacterium]
MDKTLAAIILAAGKGTRLNSREVNKVVFPFCGKPMIRYGVELFKGVSPNVHVVVGAYADSVKEALASQKGIVYIYQKQRLGTGHAVKIALAEIKQNSPSLVLVGYGDHLMFYKKSTIKRLIDLHKKQKAVVSFISAFYDKPEELAWGHIERDKTGKILDIIEHKDADEKQRRIKELNAGLYCFDYFFLKTHIDSIRRSKVSGEYYLTDIVKIALFDDLPVAALTVPFEEVGIGVNRSWELEQSQKYYKKTHASL